jgi:O-antigen chain-terminating methyltransferase
MSTEVLISLIDTAYDKLKAGGCIVLETLNPQCLMVYAQCMYLDPTHSTPVHPETVKFFMKKSGFENIEIKYFSPTDESFRLPHIKAMPEADKSVDMINHLLFGCREYAIIARK